MTQLKQDFSTLYKEWIPKPSKVESCNYSKDIQKILMRYNYLLLNHLFCKQNWEDPENFSHTLPTGVVNGKKRIQSKYHFPGIQSDIISYPLEQIFVYIHTNQASLIDNNETQIDVAEKFWIGNLGILYRIVKALWLIDILWWKHINLPVKKFIKLKKRLEVLQNFNGKDLINIWEELKINNPENLFAAVSALGFAQKFWIKKCKITKISTVRQIIEYIEKTYWYPNKAPFAPSFEREEVLHLSKNFTNLLWNDENTNIGKITSLLRTYGYTIWDIRKFTNKKSS